MDNYCWVSGTFTNKIRHGDTQGHSGSGTDHHCDPREKDPNDSNSYILSPDKCWHHQYYQWVALFIIVQAGFFYMPK